MPETLHDEMPDLRAAFAQRGVQSWVSPGNEADDLAATLACKVATAGHQATIISTDKGYCQLLEPGIRIRDYFQKRWLDAPLSPANLAFRRGNSPTTGVLRASAVQKYRGSQG
jgi:protein Xni